MVKKIRRILSIIVCVAAGATIIIRFLDPKIFTPKVDRIQAIFATWFLFRYAGEVWLGDDNGK